jgi:glutamyl-tRNA reductase
VAAGIASPVVANRSLEHGAALAARFGGRSVPLDSVDVELGTADVVVASTGSHEFVLTAERVERVLGSRRGRPIFFIDIAVPRDLDPRINDLDGCYLYDIDDLERVVAESAGLGEVTRAEEIVEEEVEAFRAWRSSLDVVPAITSLRALAEEIRASELARAERRLGPLSDEQRRTLESLTSRIVEKLLHRPTVRMKQAAATANGDAYAEAVQHLFGLDADEEPHPLGAWGGGAAAPPDRLAR